MKLKWSGSSYEVYFILFVAIALPLSCTIILQNSTRLFGDKIDHGCDYGYHTLVMPNAYPSDNVFGEMQESSGSDEEDVVLSDFKETVSVIQTCDFARHFQLLVPAIAPVSTPSADLKQTFGSIVAFTCSTSVVLTVLATIYFGRYAKRLLQQSTRNGGRKW